MKRSLCGDSAELVRGATIRMCAARKIKHLLQRGLNDQSFGFFQGQFIVVSLCCFTVLREQSVEMVPHPGSEFAR